MPCFLCSNKAMQVSTRLHIQCFESHPLRHIINSPRSCSSSELSQRVAQSVSEDLLLAESQLCALGESVPPCRRRRTQPVTCPVRDARTIPQMPRARSYQGHKTYRVARLLRWQRGACLFSCEIAQRKKKFWILSFPRAVILVLNHDLVSQALGQFRLCLELCGDANVE